MCSSLWEHPTHGPTKCGQCMECRLAYSREWAIRMSHEQLMHDRSCTLTLTYDDAHLPEYGQLVKRDLQLFFKRLRMNSGPFRYVACGEYGELNRRPHFHVALYGLDFPDMLFYGNSPGSNLPIYTSSDLFRSWSYGNALIGSLTFESAAYIARYVTKLIKGVGASRMPLAVTDDGEIIYANPEFLLMSRRPGIGAGWFDQYFKTDVFPHGRVITPQGTPAPVPDFYKRKLNAMDKMTMGSVIRKNADSVSVASRRVEDSNGRRSARSKVAKARTGVFPRNVGV